MENDKKKALDVVLEALFTPYSERVPDVQKITKAMINHGIIKDESEIVNDHIAFRTLGIPNLGINSFEKVFMYYGYEKRDYYYFEAKKLDAYWYAPPAGHYPRIFMSELRVSELSQNAQSIIRKYTNDITLDPVANIDLGNPEEVGRFLYKPLWEMPSLEEYNCLADESEYAAWVIYNRYYLNHYTISIHDLPKAYNTIEKFNTFLESIDVKLNTAGGKIKVSKDGLLKQSSTIAKKVAAEFTGGEKAEIAGSYVEFAERLPLPLYEHGKKMHYNRDQRRDGFESANADKIFESTYKEQTNKVDI